MTAPTQPRAIEQGKSFSGVPYPGLRPFRKEEYPIFFGRDDCLDQMIRSLENDRFLAVIGASGCGKSSLVRAAFFQELELGKATDLDENGGRRDIMKWQFADIAHPGETSPFDQLARALIRSQDDDNRNAVLDELDVKVLSQELREGNFALQRWAEEPGNVRSGHKLLILVDQFEELFLFDENSDRTFSEGNARRKSSEYDRAHVAQFIDLLLQTIARKDQTVFIVITMRAEFLNLCTAFRGLAERFSADAVIPPRMERDQCRQAIIGPASYLTRIGHENQFELEPELVDLLLDELEKYAPFEQTDTNPDQAELDKYDWLGRQADQLPLMQHILNQTWRDAKEASGETGDKIILTRKAYCSQQGLMGSLTRVGDTIIETLNDRQKLVARRIFCSLVSGTPLSRAVRRACDIETLMREADASEDEVLEIVNKFRHEDVCFLTPFAPRDGSGAGLQTGQKISLSHEALIRQWGMDQLENGGQGENANGQALRHWYTEEISAGAQWRLVVDSLQRQQHEFDSPTEQMLFRFRQLIKPTQSSALWRGVELAGFETWWRKYRPYQGWATRYDAASDKNFPAAERMLAESQDWRGLRQRASLAVIGLMLALTAGAGLTSWRASIATEKANVTLKKSAKVVKREQLATIIANEALTQSKNATRQAQLAGVRAREEQTKAQQERAHAQQEQDRAKAAIRLAALDRQRADQATRLATSSQSSAQNAQFALAESAVNAAVNYSREGQSDENPSSREVYNHMAQAFKVLGRDYAYTLEQRGKIADAHLDAMTHAVSQLDPTFLDDAIAKAHAAIAGTRTDQREERELRLALGRGRLLLWQGKAGEANGVYNAILNGEKYHAFLSTGSPEAKRLKMVAETGLAETGFGADGVSPPVAPNCISSEDAIFNENPEQRDIRLAVFGARCRQTMARLSSDIDDAKTKFSTAMDWLQHLPTRYKTDTRIRRELVTTLLDQGDKLVELFGPLALQKRNVSGSAQLSYSAAMSDNGTSADLFGLRGFGVDRIIDLPASFGSTSNNPLTPPDAPFRRYALIDVLNLVRSRIGNGHAVASWVPGTARATNAGDDEDGVASREDRAIRNSYAWVAETLYPAASAVTYLVDEVEARQFRCAFIDIASHKASFPKLLRDGSAIAPLLFSHQPDGKPTIPYSDSRGFADTTIASLSFGKDALRLESAMADRASRGCEGLFPSSHAAASQENDIKLGIRANVMQIAAIINGHEMNGFQTNFLNYVPPERIGEGFVFKSERIDLLQDLANEIVRRDSSLEELIEAVRSLVATVSESQRPINQRHSIRNGAVWSDLLGISLGGIDVVDCYENSRLSIYSEEEEDDPFLIKLQEHEAAVRQLGFDLPRPRKGAHVPVKVCTLRLGNLSFQAQQGGGLRGASEDRLIWLFRSKENRDKFLIDPSKYIPVARGNDIGAYFGQRESKELEISRVTRKVQARGQIVAEKLFILAQ
jgi:hypothetical protein